MKQRRKSFLCPYFGNIVPYDRRMAANSELRRLVKRAAGCEGQLAEHINEKEKQLLDTWMESYAKLQVRPLSYKTYQSFIEHNMNHIKPMLGDIPLKKLTAMDLQRK